MGRGLGKFCYESCEALKTSQLCYGKAHLGQL